MYSFLVLLPLMLITATLGGLLILSPQAADYVEYIASIEGRPNGLLHVQVPLHIAAYAIACFTLVATTHTISAPVESDRSILARLQRVLEAIFTAVPSVTLIALATHANIRRSEIAGPAADAGNAATGMPALLSWTLWAAVGIAAVGLLAAVLADLPRNSRRFKLTVIAIVAGISAVLMVALQLVALLTGRGSWLLALSAVVGAIGLAASVAAVVLFMRRELFQSTLRPLCITTVDSIAGLASAVCIALVVSLWLRPAEVAAFLGMFPVLFLASTTALLVIAFVFAGRWSSPVAILSVATSLMVVFHVVDGLLPTREFRYRSELPKEAKLGADGLSILGIQNARSIPDLPDAFRRWLRHRSAAIAKYREKGKAYPVFVVAAQGGGIYAAYHSALSLARLYDECPAFANHVFALSGVSGGALGSAVFAELLHGVPEGLRSNPGELSECKSLPNDQKLERKVKDLFAADFLSPVFDSALVFDIPSWFVPWLRFPLDRAYALEYGLENAWKKALEKSASADTSYGLKADFFGRWNPEGPAPALFLSTTAVNSGAPVLVSQIRWSRDVVLRVPRRRATTDEDVLQDLVRRLERQSDQRRGSLIGNILDFRPDLQLATSTAVALSARFPFVTPPANIKRSERIEKPVGLYRDIEVLELLDGGIFENSGGLVAIEILDDLKQLWPDEFKNDLDFHIVRFTDRPAQRHGSATKDEHFELLAPLLALNSSRVARGAELQDPRGFKETPIYLADPWFTPTLNWLLSKETKAGIEVRSGGEVDDAGKECCRVIARFLGKRPREFLLDAKAEDAEKLMGRSSGFLRITEVETFAPNNREAFDSLLKLAKEGGERDSQAAAK